MRTLAAGLSAFALAVTLSACGDSETGGDAGPANGSGSSQEAANNLVALAQSINEQAEQTSSAHLTFSGQAAGMEMSGEGDVRLGADDLAMNMTMDVAGQEMTMTMVDDAIYFNMGQEIEPGKPWVKIDLAGNDQFSQQFGSLVEQMRENADPRQALEQYKNFGTITAEKQEELNGVPTTHYSITVDVKKLVEQHEDPELRDTLKASGLTEIPLELWVNEDELPVRVAMEMEMTDPASGKKVSTSMATDYSKWGEPVEITAPAADQVAEPPAN